MEPTSMDSDQHRTPSTKNGQGNIRVNPFEKHLLDQLHKSVWSPTVFSTSTPKETPPEVGQSWNVDQISLLNPSRIEESPSTHQDEVLLTPQTEAKAQRAISKFFSQNIVPSPSPKICLLDDDDDGTENETPMTPVGGEVCAVDGDCFSLLKASLRRRKLNFTLSPTMSTGNDTEDEQMDFMDMSVPSGEVLHSPGFEDGDSICPRQVRVQAGLESPNLTPIRLNNP